MKSVVAILLLLSCGICEVRTDEHEHHDVWKELHLLKKTVKDLTCVTEALGCPEHTPTPHPGPCVFVNTDFPGNDFRQVLSPDAEHCRLACTENELCQLFAFLEPTRINDLRKYFCFLKKTPNGKPTVVVPVDGIISGYSHRICKD